MKLLSKGLTAIVLSYCLILAGCSLAWIGTLDTVLAAAAPALNNVLTIIALVENKPVNQTLEDKITADAANLKILAADFAKDSGTNPTTCQEVQAGAAVLNDDAAVVLSLVNASGSSNIAAIFAAADAFVVVIVGLIPACNSPAAIKAYKQSVPAKVAKINVNALVSNYNTTLTKTTGNAVVDAYSKANKVHAHSLFVRVVSLGFQK
jgi:hypothetical protein